MSLPLSPLFARSLLVAFALVANVRISTAQVLTQDDTFAALASMGLSSTGYTGPTGTCAEPTVRATGALTTGFNVTTTPKAGICVNGVEVLAATGTFLTATVPFAAVAGAAGGYSFDGDDDTKVVQDGANVLAIVTGNAQRAFFDSGGITTNRGSLFTTSADGMYTRNSTAATVGNQVQIAPRSRQSGQGWDLDDAVSRGVSFFTETLPVAGNTVSGIWRVGFLDPVTSAITYPFTMTSPGSVAIGGSLTTQNNNGVFLAGRQQLNSLTDGLFNITQNSGAIGVQMNTGTAAPTVTSCGAGTVTTGARNTTGQVTATGATSCTITFGAPAWTNAPFCTITPNGAPTTVPYINGDPTTTAFTVAGLTAGDNLKFSFHCVGRI